jgi:hypothetical protein
MLHLNVNAVSKTHSQMGHKLLTWITLKWGEYRGLDLHILGCDLLPGACGNGIEALCSRERRGVS